MREVLAVIPARGGSKGIPRKNLASVGGVPLVVHSIRHALESKSIGRVVVSTEDEDIARVAVSYGAEVPFLRPPELAEDHVLDQPVFAHALETLRRMDGYEPSFVVHLRPTSPFRRAEWIDEAVARLAGEPRADSIRSVSRPSQHPYRMFMIDAGGWLQPLIREHPTPYLLRRQDLPPVYYYNCVLDVTRPATVLQKQSMTGDRILPYVVSEEDIIDIDSPRDLDIARALLERPR